jgi:two-component system phosphate regulon sensor histidine kinase PhoR
MLSAPWHTEFRRLAVLLLAMLLAGLLAGHPLLFVGIAAMIYAGWHLWNLYRLEHWLGQDKKAEPPDAPGIWGEVFDRFYRLQQRNRKRKRKLAVMLRRFRESTTAMPDATVVLDGNDRIEWFNRAAGHLLGLDPSQDIGQYIGNLLRHPRFTEYLAHRSENQGPHSLEISAPHNSHLLLRLHLIPYAKRSTLLIARDITHLQRLEQIRRDFVANVSHELRTPLTVLTGFLETLSDADDECTRQWQRPLSLMAQQTARMQNIVDDLLLLSKLESGSAPNNQGKPVEVARLLRQIHEEARLLSGEQQHRFVLELDDDLCLPGQEEELRSAFSNLVFNAVRYTPAQGEITLRWHSDNAGLHFSVSDTGEGIAVQHIPRLTERFYRVDVGRSRSQGGTGLGLAIVKHVLNRHQGSLRIESKLGQGSTFICDFPPAREAAKP